MGDLSGKKQNCMMKLVGLRARHPEKYKNRIGDVFEISSSHR